MSQSLPDLEAARTKLLQQFLTLGDFRPGTVSAIPRRCGKPSCHCARLDDLGHPQFRLLRKVKGKSVAESFATPAAFRKAAALNPGDAFIYSNLGYAQQMLHRSAEAAASYEKATRLNPKVAVFWLKSRRPRVLAHT